jgi:hypothetical protein
LTVIIIISRQILDEEMMKKGWRMFTQSLREHEVDMQKNKKEENNREK